MRSGKSVCPVSLFVPPRIAADATPILRAFAVAEEGPRALYKGGLARVFRSSPQFGVVRVVTSSLCRRDRHSPSFPSRPADSRHLRGAQEALPLPCCRELHHRLASRSTRGPLTDTRSQRSQGYVDWVCLNPSSLLTGWLDCSGFFFFFSSPLHWNLRSCSSSRWCVHSRSRNLASLVAHTILVIAVHEDFGGAARKGSA